MAKVKLPNAAHLMAFSTMLSGDEDASRLHMRDLQIIALLVAKGEAMTVGAVAHMLNVSSPHISRVADKLVTRKLISRTVSADDRRIALLAPTPEGVALDNRVRAHFDAAAAAAAA